MDSLHNKKNIFNHLKNSLLQQILTCIILSSIIIIVFLLLHRGLDNQKDREYTLIEDIRIIMNDVEEMRIYNNIIELEGYAFQIEKDSKGSLVSLFLRNPNNGDEVWMDVEAITRPDVQDYFNCEYDYEHSGFLASTEYLEKFVNDCYEIIINVDIIDEKGNKDRKTVSTNRYIYKEKLLTYNPYDFNQPEKNIQSELLQRIFTEGQVYFYNKDVGMYIYKYRDKLYWIATEDFRFIEEGQTYIPFHLMTSQLNKLPDKRIQYKYDNLDFYFLNQEIKDENTKPYRIAVCDIPNDYAITYITTGLYNLESKNWIWTISFQLGIE